MLSMPSFKEFLALQRLDAMFILLPSSLVPKEALLNEGKWVSSGEKDWMLRVDPENPAIPLQRHVHIARAKHTSSKEGLNNLL